MCLQVAKHIYQFKFQKQDLSTHFNHENVFYMRQYHIFSK